MVCVFSRKKVQSSWISQIAENFKRSFKNTVRNPGYTRSRIGQCIVSKNTSLPAIYQTKIILNLLDRILRLNSDNISDKISVLYNTVVLVYFQVLALLSGLAYFKISNEIDPTNPRSIASLAQNKSGVIFFLVISFTFGNVFIQCLVSVVTLVIIYTQSLFPF